MVEISKVRIVGAGLIGTSLGLALKQLGYEIDFQDVNREAESLARDLVGGCLLTSPDLIVLATPVSAVFELLTTLYSSNPQAFFIDMTGIKSEVMQQVEEFPEIAARFCATHPMAGREFTGPTAAQSDLFAGRAWIVLPNSQTSEDLLGWLREMIHGNHRNHRSEAMREDRGVGGAGCGDPAYSVSVSLPRCRPRDPTRRAA